MLSPQIPQTNVGWMRMMRWLKYYQERENVELLWLAVRQTPITVADEQNEFIVQMIDEFQFINSEIYWDKEKTRLAGDFGAGYLSAAESKIAPLLVTGSWVG